MNSEIKIPENFISEFLSEESQPETELTGRAQNDEKQQIFLDVAEKTLTFAFNAIDEHCKQRQLPGLGKVNPDELSELSFIVAKKHIPASYLQNSPEIALVSVLGGIAVNNYLAFQKLQKNEGAKDEG